MQAGTCLLPRVSCDVAVMWNISLPSRSPSFEVSAIFPFCEIDDIFVYRKDRPYEVCIISIFFIYGTYPQRDDQAVLLLFSIHKLSSTVSQY